MKVQHIAAFSCGRHGGNPAGVVIAEALPEAEIMQKLAMDLGYSETVFACPIEDRWQVRYFSPQVEVDFCGHATIALGAALARQQGSRQFILDINHRSIGVEGHFTNKYWGASFQSPPPHSTPAKANALQDVLNLFGLDPDDLDPRIPPAIAYSGGKHFILALKKHETLRQMRYDFEKAQALAKREQYITFNLVYAETTEIFHARNPFPFGGVYEDPATGAAAAALAGYLRTINWPHKGVLLIHQGEDMGIPCRLTAQITPEHNAPITISGDVYEIHPQSQWRAKVD